MKYSKQLSFGYDSAGKRIRRRFYADTKADLNRQIEQFRRELEQAPNTSEVTFRQYSQQWLEIKKGKKSKQRQDAYRTDLRKCSALDYYPIKVITQSQLQKVVNESWDHPHAAKGVADVLRQVFQMAVDDGIISRNPALKLDRPKLPQAQHHLLTEAEIDAVNRADLNDQDRLLVEILKTFGLRPGEALALQVSDFDLNKKVLHITKALELTNDNHSQIKGTKTDAVRDIPIPDAMVPMLRKQFKGKKSLLLFTKRDGNMYTKSAYKRLQERVWSKVNEALGGDDTFNMVKGRTFYDFRHYRATELYYLTQKGVISTKYAAELMGHSEIIFLQTYSHVDKNKENQQAIYPDYKAANL